jgi:hypothetical protein
MLEPPESPETAEEEPERVDPPRYRRGAGALTAPPLVA